MSTPTPHVSLHDRLRRLYDELCLAHSFTGSLAEAIDEGYSPDSYSPDDMAHTFLYFIEAVDRIFVEHSTHISTLDEREETRREYANILARAKAKLSDQELSVLRSHEYGKYQCIYQIISDQLQVENKEVFRKNDDLEYKNSLLKRKLEEAQQLALVTTKGGRAYAL